jgi:hypothetical protein
MSNQNVYKTQNGLAMIEAALGLVLLFPVALAVISISTLVHDVGVISSVAERAIHGHVYSGLVWSAAGDTGTVRVNDSVLRPTIKAVASQGVTAVSSQVLGIEGVSALGCYVVYDVNTLSGVLQRERYRVCDGVGNLSEQLTIDRLLRERVDTARGIPISLGLAADLSGRRYFQQVVLLGLVIGGEFRGIASFLRSEVVMSGVVELPSREVSL